MKNSEQSNSLLRGAGALYLVQLISIPLGIVTNLIAGNFLEPSDYGIFFTANYIVSFICLVSNGGLAIALIREPNEISEKQFADAFFFQFVSALVLGILVALASGPIVKIFDINVDPSELRRMILLLCAVPVLQAFVTVPLVRMERNTVYGKIAKLSLAWSVLERVALILFIVIGAKEYSYAYARIFGATIQMAILWAGVSWNPLQYLKLVFTKGWTGNRDLSFGMRVQFKSLSNILQTSIIPGAGNRLFDLQTVGLLAWTNNTAYTLGQTLPQAVGRVIVGSSYRLKEKRQEFLTVIEHALSFCSIFCATMLAIISAVISELLTYLFKPEWAGAKELFALACLPMIQAILLIVYDAIVLASGRPLTTALLNWVTGGLAFGLSLAFGYWLGPKGIFIGMAVANLVPIVVFYRLTRIDYPVRLWRTFMVPIIWASAGGAITYQIKPHFIHGLPSLVLFSAAAFFATTGLYFLLHREELKVVLDLLRPKTGIFASRTK
jgi:O-antigen/teichoic acid export membrane protein